MRGTTEADGTAALDDLSPETLAQLAQFVPEMDRAGMLTEEMRRIDPRLKAQVCLRERLTMVCMNLGDIAALGKLYLSNDRLITVSPYASTSAPEVRPMTVDRFVSWIDLWTTIFRDRDKNTDEPIPVSIPRDFARVVLASDTFQSRLPKLKRVSAVPLPVLDVVKGKKCLRRLDRGYDHEHMVFTGHGFDYPTDLTAVEAMEFFRELLCHFPWALTPEEEGRTAPMFGRSFSAFMSLALTAFCDLMLPARERRPAFLVVANEVGCGKTLLVQLALAPVFGSIAVTSLPPTEEELRKLLDAVAIEGKPYLFLDDVDGFLKSGPLNRWLTEPVHAGRVLGKSETIEVERTGLTVLSGTCVTLSRDLHRRTRIIDLLARESPEDRKLPETAVELTDTWILEKPNRERWLAAMWAIVRDFYSDPMPDGWSPVPSFEAWSRLVAPICRGCQLANPLAYYSPPDTGDTEAEDARRLMEAVVEEFCLHRNAESATVSVLDMVRVSRLRGLFVSILGTVEESYNDMASGRGHFQKVEEIDLEGNPQLREPTEAEKRDQAAGWVPPGTVGRKMMTKFGRRLAERANSHHVVVQGRKWEFGQRHQKRGNAYSIRVIPAV